jgi:hypothetical protein
MSLLGDIHKTKLHKALGSPRANRVAQQRQKHPPAGIAPHQSAFI